MSASPVAEILCDELFSDDDHDLISGKGLKAALASSRGAPISHHEVRGSVLRIHDSQTISYRLAVTLTATTVADAATRGKPTEAVEWCENGSRCGNSGRFLERWRRGRAGAADGASLRPAPMYDRW